MSGEEYNPEWAFSQLIANARDTDADTEIPSFLRVSDDMAFSRALRM